MYICMYLCVFIYAHMHRHRCISMYISTFKKGIYNYIILDTRTKDVDGLLQRISEHVSEGMLDIMQFWSIRQIIR